MRPLGGRFAAGFSQPARCTPGNCSFSMRLTDFDSPDSVESLVVATIGAHFRRIVDYMGFGGVYGRFVGGYFQAK